VLIKSVFQDAYNEHLAKNRSVKTKAMKKMWLGQSKERKIKESFIKAVANCSITGDFFTVVTQESIVSVAYGD